MKHEPDLYPLFRSAWPGVTPYLKPEGLELRKVELKRGQPYLPPVGCAFVLVSGHLEEVVRQGEKRVHFAAHLPRQVTPPVVGRLIAQKVTTLIELRPGWESKLPAVAIQVEAKSVIFVNHLVSRIVSLTADTVRERVDKFCQAHPDVKSPSIVARYVGASREMCSRYMLQAGFRGRRA